MRAAERPLGHETAIMGQHACDAVDFRNLQCLLTREGRQDGAQAPRQHRLARARYPNHEDIVPARRRNFKRPFGLILPLHISEVISKDRRLLLRWHGCGC